MKKIVLISTLACAIAFGCKKATTSPARQEIKVNVRLVGIDSVSAARTEDKVLFVNIK